MSPSLIPAPAHLETLDGGGFVFTDRTVLVAPPGIARHASQLLGLPLDADGGARDAVVLTLGEGQGEEYELVAGPEGVRISGGAAGLARGLATLVQLRDLESEGAPSGVVPAVRIVDAPRYARRGLMVDVVRHWFGVPTLRRVVDLLAAYKLNVLHLHLSDDQGWRIEVPSRPELTDVSGTTQVGGDGAGFLTSADYADLVAYAAERGIEVVPEVDVPGHTNAALHALGGLSPSGTPTEAYAGTDVGFSKLDLSLPATAPFLDDVFGHLAALSPGEFLHIGGDEVHKMPRETYVAFIEHMAGVVARAGKRMIAWGEAAAADLPADAVVQLWDSNADPAPIVAAAQRGAGVLISPGNRVYLDMKYYEDFPLGQAWAGLVDVRDSYDWDPDAYVPGLDPASIVGVEAAVWTEWIVTEEDLFTMLLPRLAAIAEVAWSPQAARSWEEFVPRAAAHHALWDAAGYAYHRSAQLARA